MDSKIILFLLAALLLTSCKENKWADWKVMNQAWMDNKALEDGVKKTESGLLYKIIADPTPQDACPNVTSTIVCDYTCKLINGYQVDGGQNVALDLNNTISGFAEGCHKIHNNGDIELYIPPHLGYDKSTFDSDSYYDAEGYGTEGTQSYIPPYSALIYTVHICAVTY